MHIFIVNIGTYYRIIKYFLMKKIAYNFCCFSLKLRKQIVDTVEIHFA